MNPVPAKIMTRRRQKPSEPEQHKERLLEHFATLRIPLRREALDHALQRAEREHLSFLAFLQDVIEPQARARTERSIERRIRMAGFPERKTLEEFDWKFNAKTIARSQIEELASADFVHRRENLVFVGQSGVGKSHLLIAIGMRACAAGFSVRYETSASLITHLTAALADSTLPQRLRTYARADLLIIDEFGLDKVERALSEHAPSLLYKVVEARHGKTSTALGTNIDFDQWAAYLDDPPLATALLDRLVDRAILLKVNGESYRAARSRSASSASKK